MKFFIPTTFALCLLIGCTKNVGSSTVPLAAAISLEESEVTPVPVPTEASATAVLLVPQKSPIEGIRFLNQWHRRGESARSKFVESASSEWQICLASFVAGQSAPAAYRADLRIAVPTVFGPSFAGFAEAFGQGGLTELNLALQASESQGPGWMVWTEAAVRQAVEQQEFALGGQLFGRLLPAMLNDGYERGRILELGELAQSFMAHVSRFVAAEAYTVQSGDSLWKLCRDWKKKGVHFNSGWLKAFNGKTRDSIRLGEAMKIPVGPLTVTIWRDACLLGLYADGVPIRLVSASMGMPGEETPLGTFTIGECLKDPVYWPQDGRSAIPFGNPDNPLGTRWLGFVEQTSYGIHGTNAPASIGTFESEGCVRLTNEQVNELFGLIGPGVKVEILP